MAKHDNNRQPTLGDADNRPGAAVGTILRGARLTRDEELREVSTALRVRLPYLQAIEDGKIEDLPGITYGIGFVRAYAEHLGLDSDDIVARFKTEVRGLDKKTTLQFPEPLPGNRVPGGALILIVLLLAGSVYGGWLYTSSQNMTLVEAIEDVPKRLMALVNEDTESNPEQSPASSTPVETPAATAPEAPVTAAAEPVAPNLQTTPDSPEQSTEMAASDTATEPMATQPAASATMPPAALPTPIEVPESTLESDPESPAETPSTPAAIEPSVPPASPTPAEPAALAESTGSVVGDVTVVPEAPSPEVTTSVSDATSTAPVSDQVASTPAQPEPVQPEPVQPSILVQPAAGNADSANGVTTPTTGHTIPQSVSSAEIVEEELQPPPAPTTPPAEVSTLTATDTTSTAIATPATPAADTTDAPTDRIFIQATSESWIQVKRANGNVLVEKLMLPGEFYRVPSHSGLILNTGNAGALKLIVNGTTIPPIGKSGEVVRGVSLDAEELLQ